jgi:hypothetical protein
MDRMATRGPIAAICDRLHRDANAKGVLIIDDIGNIVARAGDAQLLSAADVIGRKASLATASELVGAFHEAASGTLYISSGQPLSIGVLFDEDSSPGLVRLRVREARAALITNECS